MKNYQHRYDNGLTLVAEPIENASSAAFTLYIPGGASYDEPQELGSGSIMIEMLGKGTEKLNSKDLSDSFDNLGVSRSRNSGVETFSFSASSLSQNLIPSLQLTSEMILNPAFPENELKSVKDLALQEVRSLDDEPASKAMVELSSLYYPKPFGNPQIGSEEGINNTDIKLLKNTHQKRIVPEHAVLGVSGSFVWEDLKKEVEKIFKSWSGKGERHVAEDFTPKEQNKHIKKDSNQVQLALAYPSVDFKSPDYYTARVANGVLSGGMSGRLFIEVREKRGLVYSVYSSHSGSLGRSAIISYAGTTPKNAKECLSVVCQELRNLKENLSDEELQRSKADLKSKIILQSEISSSRASSIAHNFWTVGRVKELSEIREAIDAVSVDDIIDYSSRYPLDKSSLVVIGPDALTLKDL